MEIPNCSPLYVFQADVYPVSTSVTTRTRHADRLSSPMTVKLTVVVSSGLVLIWQSYRPESLCRASRMASVQMALPGECSASKRRSVVYVYRPIVRMCRSA